MEQAFEPLPGFLDTVKVNAQRYLYAEGGGKARLFVQGTVRPLDRLFVSSRRGVREGHSRCEDIG